MVPGARKFSTPYYVEIEPKVTFKAPDKSSSHAPSPIALVTRRSQIRSLASSVTDKIAFHCYVA